MNRQPNELQPIPTTIGRPALRALHGAGLRTLKDVAELTERELLDLHGVGPRAITMLRVALGEQGLRFRSA